MKVTYGDLLNCVPALQMLIEMPLPSAASIRVANIAQKADISTKIFHKEKVRIAEKYAERDENDEIVHSDDKKTIIKIAEDKREACNQEIEELLELESEEDFNPLMSNTIKDVTIKPAILLSLGKLFREVE